MEKRAPNNKGNTRKGLGEKNVKWVICDTNVFISAYNGFGNTIEELGRIGNENVLIPSVSVMEFYRGMNRNEEMVEMKRKIKFYNVIHFNENASQLAIELINRYSLSHNLQIPDTIIASTSLTYDDLPLFTYNMKDFKYLPKIKLYNPSQE